MKIRDLFFDRYAGEKVDRFTPLVPLLILIAVALIAKAFISC